MSLAVKTSQEVSDNVVAQIEGAIGDTIPILPKAFSRVLAKVIGAVFVMIYKYAGFSLLQQFIRYASYQPTVINGVTVTPLVERGRELGVADPQLADRAELRILITVLATGDTLPAGTKVLWPSTGVVYKTVSPVALDSSIAFVNIVAIADQNGGDGSGTIGNAPNGTIFEIVSPPAAVARDVTVAVSINSGVDAETEDAYRARVLSASQKPQQGGSYADYYHWSLTVDNIVNAYPYTADTPGEVDIYLEVDVATDADGIPDSAKLTEVFDAIQLLRPANDAINTIAITRTAFDVEIVDLAAPDLATTKTAIETGIEEYLRNREPYISGLSVPPRVDRVTRSEIAGLVAGIVHAALGSFTTLTLEQGSETYEIYELAHGEKAKTGTVSYA